MSRPRSTPYKPTQWSKFQENVFWPRHISKKVLLCPNYQSLYFTGCHEKKIILCLEKKRKKKENPRFFTSKLFDFVFPDVFSKHLKTLFKTPQQHVFWCFLMFFFSYFLAFFHTLWALLKKIWFFQIFQIFFQNPMLNPWLALFHFFPRFFQVFSKKLCTVRSRAIQNATLGIRLFFTMHWSMKNIFPKFGPLNRKTLEDRAF